MKRLIVDGLLLLLLFCSCEEKKRPIYFDTTSEVSDFRIGESAASVGDVVSIPYEERGGVKFIKVKVNGMELDMIVDSGASTTLISIVEANYLLQKGWLSESNMKGTAQSIIADGSVVENSIIILDELIIGGKISCKNVEACVSKSVTAPLLLGNEVLDRVEFYTVDNVNKTIKFKLK